MTLKQVIRFAALVAFVFHGGPTSAQKDDSSDAARLASRWSRIAYQRFESANAYPSDQSGQMLEDFIASGAARTVREQKLSDQSDADRTIAGFADAMVQAGERQSDGRTRLGENSFASARAKICPIYPFC